MVLFMTPLRPLSPSECTLRLLVIPDSCYRGSIFTSSSSPPALERESIGGSKSRAPKEGSVTILVEYNGEKKDLG